MKNKKTIIIIAVVLLFCLGLGLSVGFTWYMYDGKDTEENYRANVAKVGYENTIESAIPQTELYIDGCLHFVCKFDRRAEGTLTLGDLDNQNLKRRSAIDQHSFTHSHLYLENLILNRRGIS